MQHSRPLRQRRAQRGVSLFFSLVALVALAFAAVALVRSVDTSALVIGNLGFKQDANATADRTAEAAIAWLQANLTGTTLENDRTANGYYATSLDALDPAGNGTSASRALVDWNGDDCAYGGSGHTGACIQPSASASYGSNTGRYVITRLCAAAGPATAGGNTCVTPLAKVAGQSPSRGAVGDSTVRLTGVSGGPYYRVLVRSVGGRGTVAYTETIVHF